MASFDFVEASSKGYAFLWNERAVIARLAVVPALLKLTGFIIILSFEFGDNFLRQGLVLVPSYFAEGWLVAQMIRLAVFNERGQAPLAGKPEADRKSIEARSRALAAGTIIYVLTKLLLAGFTGMLMMSETFRQAQTGTGGLSSSGALISALALLAFIIWAFRLVWLYVPAVMGYSLTGFLVRIKAYTTSFYMLGAWLLCFVPPVLALMLSLEMLATVFPPGGDDAAGAYTYGAAAIQSVLEVIIAVTSGVAMAYGIRSIYGEKSSK